MKLFLSYLKSKRNTFFMCLMFAVTLIVSFALYRLPLRAVLYPLGLCCILGAAFIAFDFAKVRAKHKMLEGLLNNTQLLLNELPRTDKITEEDYRQLVNALKDRLTELSAEDEKKYRSMIDYYTVWVHQIKTPIASMKLVLRNEDSEKARRLSLDLMKIEQYVEMVLTYLRLDSDDSDFRFAEYDLDGIIKGAVRKFAPEFIMRKLRLEYEPVNYRVVTDEKWLSFVIEQLISNALKYTKEGSVRIEIKNGVLIVGDTGTGIAPDDIPRIFEKGFTGANGRAEKAASGIGLYLCKKITKELGFGISAASEIGKGTEIMIDMNQKRITAE